MPRQAVRVHPYRMYRFFAADGALLYIGITGRTPFERLMEHVCDKPWASEMARWEVDRRTWPNETASLAAEASAIRAERPRYNWEHNDGNPGRVWAPPVRLPRQWRPSSVRRRRPAPVRGAASRRSLWARFASLVWRRVLRELLAAVGVRPRRVRRRRTRLG